MAFSKIIPGPVPLTHSVRYLSNPCMPSFPIPYSCVMLASNKTWDRHSDYGLFLGGYQKVELIPQ